MPASRSSTRNGPNPWPSCGQCCLRRPRRRRSRQSRSPGRNPNLNHASKRPPPAWPEGGRSPSSHSWWYWPAPMVVTNSLVGRQRDLSRRLQRSASKTRTRRLLRPRPSLASRKRDGRRKPLRQRGRPTKRRQPGSKPRPVARPSLPSRKRDGRRKPPRQRGRPTKRRQPGRKPRPVAKPSLPSKSADGGKPRWGQPRSTASGR